MKGAVRWVLRRSFYLAVVVGAFLTLVSPSLFWWVLVGLAAAGLAAVFTSSKFQQSERGPQQTEPSPSRPSGPSRARFALAGAALLGVVAVGIVTVFSVGLQTGAQAPCAEVVELHGQLQANADYNTRLKAFAIANQMTLAQDDLVNAASSPLLCGPLKVRQLAGTVIAGLHRAGWDVKPLSTAGISASRRRPQLTKVDQPTLFPGLKANSLNVRVPTTLPVSYVQPGAATPLKITIALDPSSMLTLNAPKYFVAATDPASQAQTTTADREQRQLTLTPSTKISYSVRSSRFQNEVGAP